MDITVENGRLTIRGESRSEESARTATSRPRDQPRLVQPDRALPNGLEPDKATATFDEGASPSDPQGGAGEAAPDPDHPLDHRLMAATTSPAVTVDRRRRRQTLEA